MLSSSPKSFNWVFQFSTSSLSLSLSKSINNILSVYPLMTSFITNTCMYYVLCIIKPGYLANILTSKKRSYPPCPGQCYDPRRYSIYWSALRPSILQRQGPGCNQSYTGGIRRSGETSKRIVLRFHPRSRRGPRWSAGTSPYIAPMTTHARPAVSSPMEDIGPSVRCPLQTVLLSLLLVLVLLFLFARNESGKKGDATEASQVVRYHIRSSFSRKIHFPFISIIANYPFTYFKF